MKFLIGLDIDGTIVDHDGQLHPETIAHIKKWSADGHIISLVTGRPFRNTQHIYEALALNTPICNHSGAQVHHPHDPHFPPLHYSIPAKLLHEVIDQAGDGILNGYAEVGDTVYLYRSEKKLLEWIQTTADSEVVIGTLNFGDSFTGAVLFVDPDHTASVQAMVEAVGTIKSRHWRTLRRQEYDVLEVYADGISKATALEHIRQYYGIDKANTIAIGDGTNDIEMLQYATHSAAMGGAFEEVIAAAKDRTGSNVELGAISYIKKVLGEA
jgi:Cof subfamily protein (haloacid dehalogenase superfamily)